MTPQPTYGIGLLGAGRIGERRSAALPDGCTLRAVYDVRSAAAQTLAANYSSAVVMASAEELCSRDDVNIVVVAATHDALTELALIAIKNNKHVFIEKPGARTATELREVAAAAADRGVIVGVGFNHRFHPALRAARDIVSTGKFGPLLWVRGRYGHGGRLGYDKEWRAQKALSGGGELMDQGCHLIDLIHFLFGATTLDYARLTTSFWNMEVEDNAFLVLTTQADATAWLHVSWTEWKNLFSLEITLQRAKIEVTGLGGSYGTEVLTVHEMKPEMGPPDTTRQEFTGTHDESWNAELVDFLARVEGRQGIGCDLEQAIAVHDIIAEAYRR